MIDFDNCGRMITSPSDLPPIPQRIGSLFGDFETTSKDSKLDALNVWRNCWAAGFAFTWDDVPGAWYLPICHRDKRFDIDRDIVIKYLTDLFAATTEWVNHNVKYDAHVLMNDLGVDCLSCERIVCTVVRSKILDSDRQYRGGYGLDALSLGLLKHDIGRYEHALRVQLGDSKDYGVVPPDIMGEYACQDVMTNRNLHKYIIANMPAESSPVVETETALTSELIRMERRGMLVRPLEVKITRLKVLTEMVALEQRLHEAVGYPFLPGSNKDCHDVLCNHYGLPILAYTERDDGTRGNPSFDQDTLELYLNRVDAPVAVVSDILEYRRRATFKSLFLETFEDLAIDCGNGYAVMHPDHNQCVRTGRMSVRRPNTQQQDERSKRLFLPGDGMSFMSCDASQIEFRTIAHYTQDHEVIAAYNNNPDIDYHQRVADMCGIKRRPAKTVNFSVAFGQGRGATVELLTVDKDVVESIGEAIDELIRNGELLPDGRDAAFRAMSRQRGEALYEKYHATFPNIKRTSRDAERAARERGFVRNIRGRRRYLPDTHCHKAFNTLNQSSAADIIKERMTTLANHLRGTGIEMVTQVHDEVLMVGPTELLDDPRTQRDIVAILEDVHCVRVPIRFNYGVSSDNWMMAAKSVKDGGVGGKSIPLDEIKQAAQLAHLR